MRNPGTWHDTAALSRAPRRLQPTGEEIVGAECREQLRSLADAGVFSIDIPFNRTADYPATNVREATIQRICGKPLYVGLHPETLVSGEFDEQEKWY